LNPPKYDLNPLYPKTENLYPTLETYIYNSIKFYLIEFCPVVPKIWPWTRSCRKERKENNNNNNNNNKLIIIRNGARTINLQTLFGRLNYQDI
jgi:hypothetical protein